MDVVGGVATHAASAGATGDQRGGVYLCCAWLTRRLPLLSVVVAGGVEQDSKGDSAISELIRIFIQVMSGCDVVALILDSPGGPKDTHCTALASLSIRLANPCKQGLAYRFVLLFLSSTAG